MDRNQAKEFCLILQAYAEGKVIETRTDPSTLKRKDTPKDWTEMKEIEYWNNTGYRIKPEPKYRPFANAEECWAEMLKHQPFGWIKCKEGYFNIVYVDDYCVGLADTDGSSISLASKNSCQDNTFADGTDFSEALRRMKEGKAIWKQDNYQCCCCRFALWHYISKIVEERINYEQNRFTFIITLPDA